VQDGSLQLSPQLGLELVVADLLEVTGHKVKVPAGRREGRRESGVQRFSCAVQQPTITAGYDCGCCVLVEQRLGWVSVDMRVDGEKLACA
jgi:uncharacterized protein YpuA (DUF1002 family)